jgi:CubicO group peptidase (beta-lactamase class C family)
MTGLSPVDPQAVAACARRLVATPPLEPGTGVPPGAVVGLLVGDERAVAAAGVADPATGEPMAAGLRFDLASVTKALGTTTALVALVGGGALTFDTEAAALVPTFPGHPGTTLRHLLTHRAGLPAWQPLYLAPGVRDDPWAALDRVAPDAPLDAARCYSDLGFLHLGRVVAAAAGAPLAEAIHRLALAPLGVAGAGYRPCPAGAAGSSDAAVSSGSSGTAGSSATSSDAAGVAATSSDAANVAPSAWGDRVERAMVATGDPYPVRWHDDGFAWREHLLRGEANDGNCWHAFGGVAGHAGLFATVDELLTAGRALSSSAAGEGPLPAATVREAVTAGPDLEQALGWRRDGAWVWHPGFTGCALGFLPGRPVVVAVAAGRLLADGPPVPTPALWRAAVAALAPRPTGPGAS